MDRALHFRSPFLSPAESQRRQTAGHMPDLSAELEALVALPEGIDADCLEPHWQRLLDSRDVAPGHPEIYAECFHELALRQWHSYERASESIERRVSIWISRVWTAHSESILDPCVGIIASLGLDSCLELIRSAIDDPAVAPSVALDLKRELERWGDPPLDPWRDLR